MNQTQSAHTLIEALEHEVSLLDSFVQKERELRDVVMDRNWPALEQIVSALNEAGSRISTAEQERHRAFTELAESNGLTGDVSFYDVVSHVPQEDRQYLVDLFRELKIAVMRVQGLNSGIESFVQARSSSLNDLLEVFGPSHRGKVYGRDGAQTHKGRAALVVDTAR